MIPRISMSALLPAVALLFTGVALAVHPQESGTVKTTDPFPPGTFGHDVAFFEQHHVGTIVLEDGSTGASILLVPAYQGRVMTSTARGLQGPSYGWINYALIRSGRTVEHMNPYGGEERLWLGPEGGPFSIFFKSGDPQEFAHWQVPPILDTRPFTVVSQDRRQATFTADMDFVNASGQMLQAGVRRTVRLLSHADLQRALGVAPDTSVRWVAYESENVLSNRGKAAWTKSTGMLSIWMLSMLNPSPAAVVAIPYRDAPGPVVTDDYFGKVPADRLKTADGMIFFQADGKKRSKIGVSPARGEGIRRELRPEEPPPYGALVHPPGSRGTVRELEMGAPDGSVLRRRDQLLQRRTAGRRDADGSILRTGDLLSRGSPQAGSIVAACSADVPLRGERGGTFQDHQGDDRHRCPADRRYVQAETLRSFPWNTSLLPSWRSSGSSCTNTA